MREYGQLEIGVVRESQRLGRIPRVLSYGGGKDSFCMLLLAIERGELPDAIVFMDVGNPRSHPVNEGRDAEPAEWPETYDHILDVAAPLAARHGIPFHWIIAEKPTGRLAKRMAKANVLPEIYPVRPPTGRKRKVEEASLGLYDWFYRMEMVPATRKQLCTQVAKIERFNAWLADNYPGEDVEVWIGFNADEVHRVERGKTYRIEEVAGGDVTRRVRTPLADAGLNKRACIEKMKRHRLPVPVKSACVFCPFGKKWEWLEFFARYPEMFYAVIDLWERRGLTEAGYRMAPVFKKYELTVPQYNLLKSLDRDPRKIDEVSGRERQTYETLLKHKWITRAGRPSRYGKKILAIARRRPPQPGTGAPAEWRREIIRLSSDGRPKVGVHYDAKDLEEYIEQLVAATGEDAHACFQTDPQKGALIAATALKRKASRKKNPELDVSVVHLDTHGCPDQHEYRIYAYTDGGHIVGHLDFSVLRHDAFVNWVEVRPGHRRQGVATRLYERLYSFAADEDLTVRHQLSTPEGAALLRALELA